MFCNRVQFTSLRSSFWRLSGRGNEKVRGSVDSGEWRRASAGGDRVPTVRARLPAHLYALGPARECGLRRSQGECRRPRARCSAAAELCRETDAYGRLNADALSGGREAGDSAGLLFRRDPGHSREEYLREGWEDDGFPKRADTGCNLEPGVGLPVRAKYQRRKPGLRYQRDIGAGVEYVSQFGGWA